MKLSDRKIDSLAICDPTNDNYLLMVLNMYATSRPLTEAIAA